MIAISNASQEDFPELIELFREFSTFEKMPEKMTNTTERMVNEKELFHGFIAKTVDDRIVGYATYFFSYHTWIGKSLYIDDLFVKKEYRGKGIGTALMRKIIDYAKESGCHKIRWQVSNWNSPAIQFYKSLGAQIGTTEQNCDLALR